jgi:TolA-binding protein
MRLFNAVYKSMRLPTVVIVMTSVSHFWLPVSEALAKSKRRAEPAVEEALRLRAGDETGNEMKALKTEILVSKSEARALAQLKRLEKKYAGTRMEPEILFRLAEIYMRRARTERFFEIHKQSEQIATFAPELVKDASEGSKIRQAIDIYKRIQSKFPFFTSMDSVIFNHAYASQQLGDDIEAERLFLFLTEKYKDSPLIPDSLLALGEINFSSRKYSVALSYFYRLRSYPKARAYPYGLYKAAWCHYNMQDAVSGLRQLEDVVKIGHSLARQKVDAKLDLRKEALNDMALFYSDARSSNEAVDYFRSQAGELDVAPFVIRLAELYKRHSRFSDIEIVLRDVLEKIPDGETSAAVHEELVWNYDRLKNRAGAIQQLSSFDNWCEQFVAKLPSQAKKEAASFKCREQIAETAKKMANKWHLNWKNRQSTGLASASDKEFANSAEQAYRLFLKNSDLSMVDLPVVRFSYSELLFAKGQFRKASESYAQIVNDKSQGSRVEPKLLHDSIYGALVALEKAIDQTSDQTSEQTAENSSVNLSPVTGLQENLTADQKDGAKPGVAKWSDEDERRFNQLSQTYIEGFPKGEYLLEIEFKRAFISYDKGRLDEAASQFRKIGWSEKADGQKAPEKVLKAQDLYLDILNTKKDYSGLKEAARALISRSSTSSDSGRREQIEKIYQQAYFAEIQLNEEKGDLARAIEDYKKFALENSSSDLASKAWWNASQLQFRIGDAQGGANTCYQMHKIFPQSSNGRDCLVKAAQAFESMARLDLAARVLLNLAEVEVEKQDHWRELAADFFALSGDKERAVGIYIKLAFAPDRKKSASISLAEKAEILAREKGDVKILSQIESWYASNAVEPQSSRVSVAQAEDAYKQGDHSRAFHLSKKIMARQSLPAQLHARARFIQGQVLEEEYRKQSVKAKADRIGLVLTIKTEKLEKAQKAYQSTIRYGDPVVSVSALRRLAGCYLDYAKSVRGISLGAQASASDQAAFKDEIEKIAMPMEEKGIEAMSQALEAARKAQIRDGQIAEIYREIDRLNMKVNPVPLVKAVEPVVYLPVFRSPASQERGL